MPNPKLPERKRKRIHELGAQGMTQRKIGKLVGVSQCAVHDHLKKPVASPVSEAELPESWAEEYEPFTIDGPCRALLLSDIHIPFHDRKALEAAVEVGKREAANVVVLNGDALDFHAVSRYDHDGSKLTYQMEIEGAKKFVRWIRNQFPKARIIFKEGNHEERLERYILSRAPALFGLENVTLRSLVGLDGVGAEHVGEQRVIRLGKLRIIHGHEYGGGVNAPVNAARWLLLRARRSAIMGHLHHTSYQPETDIDGEQRGAWSLGCLCGLHPRYRRLAQRWNHGFAVVSVDKAGAFDVRNHQVIGGKVV